MFKEKNTINKRNSAFESDKVRNKCVGNCGMWWISEKHLIIFTGEGHWDFNHEETKEHKLTVGLGITARLALILSRSTANRRIPGRMMHT